MPGALERSAHVLLIDGPLKGSKTVFLDGDALVEGLEFDVAAWDDTGRTERYVITRGFEVQCREHRITHRRVIAAHRPRVTV